METTMHNVSSISISKRDLDTFGVIDVDVTTSKGEKFTLQCFHRDVDNITIETTVRNGE